MTRTLKGLVIRSFVGLGAVLMVTGKGQLLQLMPSKLKLRPDMLRQSFSPSWGTSGSLNTHIV